MCLETTVSKPVAGGLPKKLKHCGDFKPIRLEVLFGVASGTKVTYNLFCFHDVTFQNERGC